MPTIRHQLGKLPYRGGGTSRTAPKISTLGENTKEVNKDGHRIARPQGKSVTKTVDGSEIHQWQGVFIPTCGNNLQEDLHHDGSAIMYNGRTAITRRAGTRGLQDDKMDEGDTDDPNDDHDEGGPLREATLPHFP